MRKRLKMTDHRSGRRAAVLLTAALLFTGCGKEAGQDAPAQEETVTQEAAATQEAQPTEEEEMKKEETNDPIADAIAQEKENVDGEAVQADESEERVPTAVIGDEIPLKYSSYRVTEYGRLEKISYSSKDYFGDGSEITKDACVAIPTV